MPSGGNLKTAAPNAVGGCERETNRNQKQEFNYYKHSIETCIVILIAVNWLGWGNIYRKKETFEREKPIEMLGTPKGHTRILVVWSKN